MNILFPTPEMNDDTGITFSSIDVDNISLPIAQVELWLKAIANSYNKDIFEMSYLFCSDEYLHKMNVEYLDHDTYTDIITFDLSEEHIPTIHGECFISLDRIKENAVDSGVTFENEMLRVIAHGLLHLCGLKDKTEEQQKEMTEAENKALKNIDCSTWNM